MNKLGLNEVVHERLRIDVADTVAGVMVVVVGDIDMQDPSKLLDPFFLKLHQGSVAQGVSVIDLDFRKLNFLNSSGIKALAKWIMMLATTPKEKRYAVKILHDKLLTWQATSLPTLTYLVPGVVTLA